jgi:hypothetical protein
VLKYNYTLYNNGDKMKFSNIFLILILLIATINIGTCESSNSTVLGSTDDFTLSIDENTDLNFFETIIYNIKNLLFGSITAKSDMIICSDTFSGMSTSSGVKITITGERYNYAEYENIKITSFFYNPESHTIRNEIYRYDDTLATYLLIYNSGTVKINRDWAWATLSIDTNQPFGRYLIKSYHDSTLATTKEFTVTKGIVNYELEISEASVNIPTTLSYTEVNAPTNFAGEVPVTYTLYVDDVAQNIQLTKYNINSIPFTFNTNGEHDLRLRVKVPKNIETIGIIYAIYDFENVIYVNDEVFEFNVEAPTTAFANDEIKLTISLLKKFSYPIDKYIVDFGDGTTNTYTSRDITYKYTKEGTYYITTKAIDTKGNEQTIISTIEIKSLPSEFSLSMKSYNVKIYDPIDFNIIITSEGSIPIKQYIIDFGDGTTETYNINDKITKSYAETGNYKVKISSVNSNGEAFIIFYFDMSAYTEEEIKNVEIEDVNLLSIEFTTASPVTDIEDEVDDIELNYKVIINIFIYCIIIILSFIYLRQNK